MKYLLALMMVLDMEYPLKNLKLDPDVSNIHRVHCNTSRIASNVRAVSLTVPNVMCAHRARTPAEESLPFCL